MIIGNDYHYHAVDHEIISKENVVEMKLAYAQQAVNSASENTTKAN